MLRSTSALVVGAESDLVVEAPATNSTTGPSADEVARAAGAALACLAGIPGARA
jgi:hypothetical protein